MLITSRSARGRGGDWDLLRKPRRGGGYQECLLLLTKGGGGLKSPQNGLRNKRMVPKIRCLYPSLQALISRNYFLFIYEIFNFFFI